MIKAGPIKRDAVTVNHPAIIVTKRGRGRPATGAAKTDAQRQKAYRARKKAAT